MGRHLLGVCFVIALVVVCTAYIGLANTITVENLSQNTATGVYTYAITFDTEAYVTPGDGFTIYNFGGLTSWSLSGTGSSGSLDSTSSSGPIRLVQQDTGSALTDGNGASIANADGAIVATDNGLTFPAGVPDLSFIWQGPPTIYTGSATATLTLDSSILNGDSTSVYASVDRSGSNPGTTYGTAEGTVFVPAIGSAVPEPASGMLLLGGLCALALRRRKARLAA